MNKIDKNELFNKLSKARPEDIKRIGLDNNEIEYIKNKILTTKLGLQLNWEEKDENLDQNYFGLEEINELSINIKEQKIENHLLIEGDNYYALKALQISGIKVDVIYIDPPYNTGNKDFVYEDHYVDKEDKFKHSKWLTFMKNRLILAKELLADDGVIFISIDDNEQAYLKVLMDEIFGEENFIGNLARQTKNGGGRFGKIFIQKDYDYLICYLNKKELTNEFNNKLKEDGNEWDDYKFKDERGPYALKHPLDGGAGNKNYNWCIKINNKEYFPRTWWSFSKARIDFMLENNFLVPNENKKLIYVKDYKNWEINVKEGDYSIISKEPGTSWSTSKLLNKIYNNAAGNNEIVKIFGTTKEIFTYPKPSKLIKDIINMINNKNTIVLDFFAGSGTTGQAVMELNKEDGGNRRFILCTNNENNIARDVCRERLYRVINGVGSKNESIDWKYSSDEPFLKNNSVKYLRVKNIHKINGEYEEINDMKELFQKEFKKDLSIKDFK